MHHQKCIPQYIQQSLTIFTGLLKISVHLPEHLILLQWMQMLSRSFYIIVAIMGLEIILLREYFYLYRYTLYMESQGQYKAAKSTTELIWYSSVQWKIAFLAKKNLPQLLRCWEILYHMDIFLDSSSWLAGYVGTFPFFLFLVWLSRTLMCILDWYFSNLELIRNGLVVFEFSKI